jgi:hypothetical protein
MWKDAVLLKRAVLVVAFLAALGYGVHCSWVLFGSEIERLLRARSFDSATWRNREASMSRDYPIRAYMVDDLVRGGALDGKSVSEIAQLLGPPTGREPVNDASFRYVYWVGPSRGFIPLGNETLVIEFEHERVSSVRTQSD